MESNPLPAPAPVPHRNWWERNWKWFVPTGCLVFFLLVAGFVLSICFVVFTALKSTDVYKDAVARAENHPAVIEALGSPVRPGLIMSGSTSANGASGQADLAIPISGPKGSGTLYVVATKSAGQWEYSKLVVEVGSTRKRIDLKPEPTPTTQQ